METLARSDSFLRQKGVKASFQHVCLYDGSMNLKVHPVSQMFSAHPRRIPSLPRVAVFSAVHWAVDKNTLGPVRVDSPGTRYALSEDGCAQVHCMSFGGIFGIPTDEIAMPELLTNCSAQEVQFHFKGLCPGCR